MFGKSTRSTRFHPAPQAAVLPALLLLTMAHSGAAFSQETPAPADVYFPVPGGAWRKLPPQEAGFDPLLLRQAVDFALAHESAGDRDLGLQIALSFHREPFDGIVGPTKERGDPSGLVIRHGYIVAEWGPTHRVDMTFYGFMNWFLNTEGEGRVSSGPRSAVAHLGFGTNALFVDWENDLVVVVRWIEGRELKGFVERVLAALR